MAVGIFKDTLLNLIALIPVDAKLSEGHKWKATPTTFAIEDGSEVTDHVILNPIVLEMDILVTNQDVPGTSIAASYGVRAIVIFQLFLNMYITRSLHTIVTRHTIYPNMCLIEVPFDHNAPFTGSFSGTVKFQQISTAKLFNVVTSIDQLAEGVAFQAANATSFGNKITEPLSTTSALYEKILDSAGVPSG